MGNVESRFAIVLYALAFTTSTVPANAEAYTPQSVCQSRAYVVDPDPQGLNVRQDPSTSGVIVGKLPLNSDVQVLAHQGNWFKISPLSPELQGIEFQGSGWVYGPLLGIKTKGYDFKPVSLYSQPDLSSETVGSVPPDTSVDLLGCEADWLMVEHDMLSGWLEPAQQCPAALTTCP
jgi:SH3-like domain-containing protein